MADPLEAYRQRWLETRHPRTLLGAVKHLHAAQQPPPLWLLKALAQALPLVPSRIDVQDFVRWTLVRHGRQQGHKWTDGEVYRYAAQHCGGHVTAAAVRRSYLKVTKARKNPRTAACYPDVLILEDGPVPPDLAD